ncbi:MAG: LTA synthase family protein [Ferruginibacter sp.]
MFITSKKGNYYWVYLYRLALVMVLFILCRILFYFLNISLFPGIHFTEWVRILKGGFVFDTSALFYFNGIFILLMLLPFRFRSAGWYQRFIMYIFFITNGLAILLNCIDFIYYRFTLRRTTRPVFSEFSHEVNKTTLFKNFMLDYWYIVLIFTGLTILMIWAYKKVKIKVAVVPSKSAVFYPTAVVVFLASITLAVGGIRGDFKYTTRPITISNAGEYVNTPNEMYLVLNTPFCMVRTWNVKGLEEIKFFTDAEVEKIYSPVHYPKKDTVGFVKKNVVIFILESFGKEAVGGYNRDLDDSTYTGFTPFLDSLMTESRVYWNSFGNGRKSIDALPSVLAGIPNGKNPFVLTPYATDSLHTLPQILNEEGYSTSFFHGAPNGSMGFKALMNVMRVQHYYGKDEYNNDNDFDGVWGIWDEPFFQFFGDNLDTFRQPFFSTIFSVSSHHPFKVPKKYEGKFKKGPLPVLECISYTDLALRRFFEKVSKSDWFKNTIFVITADHATVNYHPEYLNAWGEVAIPILLYSPGDAAFKGVDTGIIQQIDIMPSVLSYLHYDKPFIAFGKNVFDSTRLNFAVMYGGGYSWIEDDYVLFFDDKESKSLHNFKEDRLFKNELLDKEPAIRAVLEKHVKAFMQQYNNRLLRNQLKIGAK